MMAAVLSAEEQQDVNTLFTERNTQKPNAFFPAKSVGIHLRVHLIQLSLMLTCLVDHNKASLVISLYKLTDSDSLKVKLTV